MTLRGALVAAAAGVAVATVVAGCGADDEQAAPSAGPTPSATTSSPSQSPSASQPGASTSPAGPDWTDCAEIWVAGKRLPLRYQGCDDGGRPVPANGSPCVVGHDLVVYQQRFYAMATGKIFATRNLAEDPGYAQMRSLCKKGMSR